MSFSLGDAGWLWAFVLGAGFGFVLEAAGFGSARKLTAQFLLKDWAVFKVMFTAVIVAGAGLVALEMAGVMSRDSVYVPTLFWWATLIGGGLIGAGFALGGYCPGTALAALGSGRLDSLAFIAGMVSGIWLFAIGYDDIAWLMQAAQAPARQTLDGLTGLAAWLLVAVMALVAAGGFALARRFEAARGGPLTAQDVLGGDAPAKVTGSARPASIR